MENKELLNLEEVSKSCGTDDAGNPHIFFEDPYDIAIQIGMTILAFNEAKEQAVPDEEYGWHWVIKEIKEAYAITPDLFQSKVNRIFDILNED